MLPVPGLESLPGLGSGGRSPNHFPQDTFFLASKTLLSCGSSPYAIFIFLGSGFDTHSETAGHRPVKITLWPAEIWKN